MVNGFYGSNGCVFRSSSFAYLRGLFCNSFNDFSVDPCFLGRRSLNFGDGSFSGRNYDHRRVFFIGAGLPRPTGNLFNFRFILSIRRRGFFGIDSHQTVTTFGQPTVNRKAFPDTLEKSACVVTKSIKDEFARGFNGVRGVNRRNRRFFGFLDDD